MCSGSPLAGRLEQAVEAELERRGECLVFRVKGDIRLWSRPEQAESLLEKFRSGLGNLPAQLVLSLGGVTHVDTRGIMALASVLEECSKRKIELKIVMPSGVAAEPMRYVRIFAPWPSFPNETAALQAVGAPPP